jgi:tRNA-(ms[2]io[6]A)-hydroxylase
MDDKPKRRLPVLKEPEVADPGDADRPPWHWSAIGTVAIFVLWLPLAYLSAILSKHLLGGASADDISFARRALIAGINLLGFMIGAFGGGAIVGRFGGKAGLKEATFAGFATALIAWITIAWQGAGIVLLAVLIGVSSGMARLGAWVGMRMRVSAAGR